jgi:hypothetical protein
VLRDIVPGENGVNEIALAIVHAKARQTAGAQEHFPMLAQHVAGLLFSCKTIGVQDVWKAMRAINGTPIWLNTWYQLTSEDPAHANLDRVALRVLKDLGLDAGGAAALLKSTYLKDHFYDQSDTSSAMQAVGYGWWETFQAMNHVYLLDKLATLSAIANGLTGLYDKLTSPSSGTNYGVIRDFLSPSGPLDP